MDIMKTQQERKSADLSICSSKRSSSNISIASGIYAVPAENLATAALKTAQADAEHRHAKR
jgi:hypothetical protein